MAKIVTAYFSASGVTAKAAKILADASNADIYEIRSAVPYTKADLDWMNKNSRSSVEMNDLSSRPAISDSVEPIHMADYDTVFLCFPIWWYREPSIIDTFLESYDFSGKKIVLFATSGGSGFGKTAQRLQKIAPSATITEGRMLNGRIDVSSLKAWMAQQ
ncbi:MAG: flavodoxin [Eubacteriales bacterium]|nr:flavodoxin [Eubacteriales bacterium]